MSATCVGKFWALTSFVASVASAAGFYFPYWLEGRYVTDGGDVIPMYFGVFRRCSYPRENPEGGVVIVEECGRYSTFLDIPSLWWQICTITVGSGTCLSLLLSLTAIISLCIRDIITVHLARVAGLLQLSAGLLIAGGVAIYPNGWDNPEVLGVCGPGVGPYRLGECTLYWAFYMAAVGGGVTILCSCLTCHAYRHKTDRRSVLDV